MASSSQKNGSRVRRMLFTPTHTEIIRESIQANWDLRYGKVEKMRKRKCNCPVVEMHEYHIGDLLLVCYIYSLWSNLIYLYILVYTYHTIKYYYYKYVY